MQVLLGGLRCQEEVLLVEVDEFTTLEAERTKEEFKIRVDNIDRRFVHLGSNDVGAHL